MAAAVPMNLPRDVSMVTETTYTTVDVAVTLMVDENGVPFETVAPANVAPVATTPVAVTTSASSPPASTTPVVVTTTPVAAAAPVAASSSSPVAAAAASPAASNPASGASADSSGISASATNMCTGKSDACEGDITHYDGGQSACGPIVDSDTEMGIALPFEFMGTLSNNNPYCGRSVTIHNPSTGLEVTAKVVEKCGGCYNRAIDLTNAAFNAIAPSCDGRCSGFIWWFN